MYAVCSQVHIQCVIELHEGNIQNVIILYLSILFIKLGIFLFNQK